MLSACVSTLVAAKDRANSRYFSTVGFPADSRGPDADHSFTIYDSQNQKLYVWYKFNFLKQILT
jgi:hypothetical protein